MTRYNFLRRNTTKYLRLGKKRKKTQRWKRPKGRDNKMRLGFRGYPKTVSIGYTRDKMLRGKVENKIPVTVRNVNDLAKIKNENIALMGRVGNKKKIEIVKAAKERKINIFNVNMDKILKEVEKKTEEKSKEKAK